MLHREVLNLSSARPPLDSGPGGSNSFYGDLGKVALDLQRVSPTGVPWTAESELSYE